MEEAQFVEADCAKGSDWRRGFEAGTGRNSH